jgi:hypothetical protein
MAIKGVAEFYEGSGKKHIVTTQTASAWHVELYRAFNAEDSSFLVNLKSVSRQRSDASTQHQLIRQEKQR